MQAKHLACLLTAASLMTGSLSAFAQDHGRNDRDHGHDRWNQQQQHDQRAMGNRGNDRDHDRDRNDGYYYGARGPEWHRGGHLPAHYRSNQYVVNDWHGHHLSAPPRGYHWVQVGNDYVLAAIATGVIAQLLLNN